MELVGISIHRGNGSKVLTISQFLKTASHKSILQHCFVSYRISKEPILTLLREHTRLALLDGVASGTLDVWRDALINLSSVPDAHPFVGFLICDLKRMKIDLNNPTTVVKGYLIYKVK